MLKIHYAHPLFIGLFTVICFGSDPEFDMIYGNPYSIVATKPPPEAKSICTLSPFRTLRVLIL